MSFLIRNLAGSRLTTLSLVRRMSASAEDSIVVTKNKGVTKIRLNKPKKFNAVDMDMYKVLTNSINEASNDKDTRVVVLTGTGKYFSAGNDLSAFAKLDLSDIKLVKKFADEGKRTMIDFVDSLITCKKPFISAVNGPAIGLFVTTLALTDVIWCSDTASFSTPFSATAQTPEGVSSQTFVNWLGPSMANEMLLFNRVINSQEALTRGFVSRVLPTEGFDQEVDKQIAALLEGSSQRSMEVAKSLIRDQTTQEQLKTANRIEADELVEAWFDPEFPQFIMQFMMRKQKA